MISRSLYPWKMLRVSPSTGHLKSAGSFVFPCLWPRVWGPVTNLARPSLCLRLPSSPGPWPWFLILSMFPCSLTFLCFSPTKSLTIPTMLFYKTEMMMIFTFFSSHRLLVYICQDGTGSPQGTSGTSLAGAGWITDKQLLHSLTHEGPFISS